MKNKAFTLIEVLITVLIIGILAAIAVPKYQLAVDKTRYSRLMSLTRTIAEAQIVAQQAGLTPDFNNFDVNIPSNCSFINSLAFYCEDLNIYCGLNNYTNIQFPRCEDTKLKVSYYYIINHGVPTRRICYANTTDITDRSNRLCQAIVGHKTSFDDTIGTYSGGKASKGYYF